MFYELETLESQLKCPICLRKFNSPRILPCGKSVCLTCIEELSKQAVNDNENDSSSSSSSKSLSCPICQKTHLVPNEGFILNEFILNTLQLKPQKVYRCPSFEKFDHLLAKIKEELVEIEEKLDRPSDKIVEYCDRLRNQIDIRTEVLIEKLNGFRDDLLTELKSYEQKCLKTCSIANETRNTFDKQLKEIGLKLADHHKYLNQARIDEVAVKKMYSEAKINEFNLSNYAKLLDSKLFGSSLIRFDCFNGDESSHTEGVELMREVLGRLNYEELKMTDEKILNPDKLTHIKPEKTIECKIAVDQVKELEAKYIVSSENTVKIFDSESSEATAEIRFDQNPECLLTNSRDLILVQHTRNIWKNNRKEKNNFSSLSVYDLNLNLKSEISVDFTIGSCCSSTHSIFVQSDRTMLITVLNWSLEKITAFGQIHFPEKPYFFRDSSLRFVKDDRIYLKKTWTASSPNGSEMSVYQMNDNNAEDESGFIRVVSLTNGELITQYSLSLRDEYFIVDGLMRTIVIDVEDSWLRIYDKPKQKVDKVELIYEREVDGLKDVSDIRVTQDGRLCFIRNKRFIQYISLYS